MTYERNESIISWPFWNAPFDATPRGFLCTRFIFWTPLLFMLALFELNVMVILLLYSVGREGPLVAVHFLWVITPAAAVLYWFMRIRPLYAVVQEGRNNVNVWLAHLPD